MLLVLYKTSSDKRLIEIFKKIVAHQTNKERCFQKRD